MAVKKAKRTTRGWRKDAPRTREEKRRIAAKCGNAKVFLAPKSDPGKSTFPVVSKYSRTCQVDCQGLRTAYARAKQYKHRKVAQKAMRLAKRVGCDWAR